MRCRPVTCSNESIWSVPTWTAPQAQCRRPIPARRSAALFGDLFMSAHTPCIAKHVRAGLGLLVDPTWTA
jgi:hypothetical protein